MQANFSDPVLRGWTKALADTSNGDLVMRIGGGPQDEVVFAAGNYSWHPNVNQGGGCNASAFDYSIGDCVVLTPQHFSAMMDFSHVVGVKLVFGLSAMYGACCVRYDDTRIIYGTGHCAGVNLTGSCCRAPSVNLTGSCHRVPVSACSHEKVPLGKCRPWDSSNTLEILKHAHAHPHPPFGFELGNELDAAGSDRTGPELLSYFVKLAAMIDEVWSDTPKDMRPKVIGFDNDFGGAAYNRSLSVAVLETAKPFLHAFTYHQYGCGGGPDPKCVDKEYLHGGGNGKSGAADYSLVRKVVPAAEIWLGEGGGQGCASGPDTQQLKSNELTDVYWWLDALGALALSGQQRWLRETLAGGWYGLVNLTSMEVYPDYYGALLFSKLMGPEVLTATVSSGVQYSPKAYAHCARQKGYLTLLLFNFGNTSVTAAIAPATGSATGVYRLNGPLYGHGIYLNGKLLQLGDDKALPPMEPVAPSGPLVLAPLDIAFVTVKTEGKACQ